MKRLNSLHRAAGLAAVMLMMLMRAATAQPYDSPPPPAAPRPLQMPAPQEAVLPSGLRVVVAERHGLPIVSVLLLVLSGAEADPPRLAGTASLTAGLLTRGTRRQSAPVQAAAAETLGGTLASAAGWHQSGVRITVTTPRLAEALGLVAQAVTEPAFAAAEIERLRAETLDDLKVAYTRPGTLAALASNRTLFGDGAYGRPAAGTPKSLARITRADILRLHRERYRPDNAVLVLAGDITLEQALALARQPFGAWQAPGTALPATVAAAGPSSAQALTLVDMGDSGQAGVALALPLPAASSPDLDAGQVANSVLGGGYSSRLNQEIRIKRGLSYGAGSGLDARRQAGLLRVAVQTKNASAAEVVSLVQAELDSLAATPVPDAELAARKATLIGSFSRSVETTDGLAAQVAELVVTGRPVAELTTRIARLAAVDSAGVQRYARQHFDAARRRIAVAGDSREFEAALKAALQAGAKEAQPPPLTVKAADFDLGD
jgi:zinc protease